MIAAISHLFWDSCVFHAFLRDERAAYDVDSIQQYIEEARAGKCRIYTSSLVFAEVLPSSITSNNVGSFQDFVEDLQGAAVIIDASPSVMQRAGFLRDLPYRKGRSPGRRLGTPDAIMLASCLELMDTFGVKVDCFHTFDDGKKRGPEGRMVPLLSYQEWCEGFATDHMSVAQPVIALNRRKPIHPSPTMFGAPKIP